MLHRRQRTSRWNGRQMKWQSGRMITQCASYADRFRSEEIDGRSLMLLNMEHLLVRLALPLGAAVKIFEGIRELHESRHQ
ncbi:hypothetical protein HPB50_021126 [Hyalomma asiaticum]|uniref:Uncharacterized protein n=1 Tax=Hyalomma asiaticum TaxID=266040 RepID=A0ACB7TL15_HYAAI|nr:hypothetical protein HPB50_021126 [Hyalomma asiaticum]